MELQDYYSDRFDVDYLKYLIWLFSPDKGGREYLMETATIKTDKNGKPLIDKKKQERRIINIDYCGFASNTLLVEKIEGVVGIDPKVIALREEVARVFKAFMAPASLAYFREKNVGVKVRFCFNYIYSDLPVCMARSEISELWEHETDDAYYDFNIDNAPLTTGKLENSLVFSSQDKSRKSIVKLLQQNKDLIITEGKNKYENLHTLQVRFAVIPIGVCSLQINKTIFCDGYLYAKIGKDRALSVHYPLHALDQTNKSHEKQFISVVNNFKYLWRHDLTLFCGDATQYAPGNVEGLVVILKPFNPDAKDSKESNINWEHKIKVILEKKKKAFEDAGKDISVKQLRAQYRDKIEIWRDNLNERLFMCTRKLREIDKKALESVTIEMGWNEVNKYYLKLKVPSLNIDINRPFGDAPNKGYFNLLHLVAARKEGVKPVLNKISSAYADKYIANDGKWKHQKGKFAAGAMNFISEHSESKMDPDILKGFFFELNKLDACELLIAPEDITITGSVKMLDPSVGFYYALLKENRKCKAESFYIMHPLHFSPEVFQVASTSTFKENDKEGSKTKRIDSSRIIGYPSEKEEKRRNQQN